MLTIDNITQRNAACEGKVEVKDYTEMQHEKTPLPLKRLNALYIILKINRLY